MKFKYFVLGNGERNDYKKETITLPAAKRTKVREDRSDYKNSKKVDSANLEGHSNTEKMLLKTKKVI